MILLTTTFLSFQLMGIAPMVAGIAAGPIKAAMPYSETNELQRVVEKLEEQIKLLQKLSDSNTDNARDVRAALDLAQNLSDGIAKTLVPLQGTAALNLAITDFSQKRAAQNLAKKNSPEAKNQMDLADANAKALSDNTEFMKQVVNANAAQIPKLQLEGQALLLDAQIRAASQNAQLLDELRKFREDLTGNDEISKASSPEAIRNTFGLNFNSPFKGSNNENGSSAENIH